MAHNTAEPTTSPYTLLGAELAPFWSGSSMIGAALFIELIQLSLERWLLLELIGSFFRAASFWSELLWLLLWTGPDPLRADPTPFGAVAPLWSWSDSLLGAVALLGADPSFGAPLAHPERRLLFGAPLAPSWADTTFGALLAPLERRLFFGASLAPFGAETPFWSPSGSSGADALLRSFSGSLWRGDSFWSPSGSSGAEALPWSLSGSLWSGDSFWSSLERGLLLSGSLEWSQSGSLWSWPGSFVAVPDPSGTEAPLRSPSSSWGDSSLGAALAPSLGAELDLCWENGHIYVNTI